MFDPEQYANTQYHSRPIDPTNQTPLIPYLYPTYRSGFNTTSNMSSGKNEHYICKWISPDTNRLCNRTFAYMQDIGKRKSFTKEKYVLFSCSNTFNC